MESVNPRHRSEPPVARAASGSDNSPSYVVDEACTACGACLLTCPEHAFVVGVPLVVDPQRCTDCGECIEICPADAIARSA